MNLMHRRLCSSQRWADMVSTAMSDYLTDVDLGDDVLEIGPGYGATTRALAPHVGTLTAVEVDEASAARLRTEFDAAHDGNKVEIVHGDGAALPFPDGRFSAVVCFTMLHHVPSTMRQDALFAEARRVLRPGGVFRGVDSQPSVRFRILHIGDTMVTLDAATLPDRLRAAGFVETSQELDPGKQIRFVARNGA